MRGTLLALLCAVPALAASPPRFVKVICNSYFFPGGYPSPCTGAGATTGDLVVVHLGWLYGTSANATNVTDGVHNYTSSGPNCYLNYNVYMHYAQWYGSLPSTAWLTYTFTPSPGGTYQSMLVVEYSGAAASNVLDTGASAQNCATGQPTSIPYTFNFGGVTTTGANETIVCGLVSYGGTPYVLGTGFADLAENSGWVNVGSEDMAAASATSYGTTINTSTSAPYDTAGGCVSYIGAASAATRGQMILW